jgi:hypothetical protein
LVSYIGDITIRDFFYFSKGRIMNRFTKDLAMIDEQLPMTLFDFSDVNV